MKKRLQKGFTLIELMIVVAIIGILASIALPAYQDYTVRAKVSEGSIAASSLKVGIADLFGDDGVAGITAYSNEVVVANTTGEILTDKITAVRVSTAAGTMGRIEVDMAGVAQLGAGFQTLAYLPTISLAGVDTVISDANSAGSIEWQCNPADNAAATTILPKYLPAACR